MGPGGSFCPIDFREWAYCVTNYTTPSYLVNVEKLYETKNSKQKYLNKHYVNLH